MFDSAGRLEIFEAFQIDVTLPKYRRFDKEDAEDESQQSMKHSFGFRRHVSRGGEMSDDESVYIRTRSRRWWWPVFQPDPRPTMSVQQFFTDVKNSMQELEIINVRAAGYEAAILMARQFGQTALLEQLEQSLVAVRAEIQLAGMGLVKYVDEATIVEFAKKTPQGLRCDWIANFTRMIPTTILATKKRADTLQIFDNYVVLHYDPALKSWAETQAERTRRMDPILFGVIRGRRLLYYVGDWTDLYCTLTLDQIAESLGAEAIKAL